MASHAEGPGSPEQDEVWKTYVLAQLIAMESLIQAGYFENDIEVATWYDKNFAAKAELLAKNPPLIDFLTARDQKGAANLLVDECKKILPIDSKKTNTPLTPTLFMS